MQMASHSITTAVAARAEPDDLDDQLRTWADRGQFDPEERRIFSLLVRGCSNAEIGAALDLDPMAVKQMVRSLIPKLRSVGFF
jgi:DNA-binding NarL/FixJ family response regulator